ncbi:fimbrial protein [Pseudomonas alkylphenolica]|uniref:P pilus assembly protein, pilin FimA n=1 Tax=Pseudomonas alkylphenolica TaxID=237609 RepID=A0A077FBL9_9PSED|nr:fimbrial protein [Pseudomonas alkylphenolica]AIL61189.1 P pilus assembly protein, pilin FimA [Pseudomonas alkylphenolica]
MTLNKLLLLTTLACAWQDASANCKYYVAHQQNPIIIDIPPTLSIPRDTPNNTTIYESNTVTFYGNSSLACTNIFLIGVKNNLGTGSPTSDIFPISNSGLAWQWVKEKEVMKGFGSATRNPGGYGFNGTTHSLRLLKIAPLKGNITIPAGDIGYYQMGTIQPLAMRISKSVSIVAQSCETPDIKVEMGQYDLGVFSDIGDTSKATAFNILLNNCPSGINKVMYSLAPNPTTPAWDAGQGIIELNKTSTAKGIALQILDGNQTPLELNKDHVFSDYTSTGGNFRIPLSARYYRTLPASSGGKFDLGVRPGTANSEVSFVMSYL